MLSCFFCHPVTVSLSVSSIGWDASTSWTGFDYISFSRLFWWDLLLTNKHSDISLYCADIRLKLQQWLTEHVCATDTLLEILCVRIVCCMNAEVTPPYFRRPTVGHISSRLTLVTSCSSVALALVHPPTSLTCDNYLPCLFLAWCNSRLTAVYCK